MFHPPIALRHAVAALLLAGGLQTAALANEPGGSKGSAKDSGFFAGISIRPTASAEQLGLPLFPGAVPFRDTGEEHAGASIGAWGGPFGLQVHALKLRSSEPVEAVARWYREAMARQGKVLDCSQAQATETPAATDRPAGKPADGKPLRCGRDRPEAGGVLYKQGTRNNVHVVALEPLDGGTRISLVRVEVRGDD